MLSSVQHVHHHDLHSDTELYKKAHRDILEKGHRCPSYNFMPPIINARDISKAFGASPLFRNVSFSISEGDRIGLIGPNGSGKSTLLRILAGFIAPDSGDVAIRKRTRMSYLAQESEFEPGETARSVMTRALKKENIPE